MSDATPQSASERWMTTEAAATYLSCAPSRVRLLVKEGRLEAARNGRRLMFRRTWLDECLDPVETEPSA